MSSSRLEILNDGGKLPPSTFLFKNPRNHRNDCILNISKGLRHDSRRPYELRSTSFQLSTHPSADGSSTVTQGLTCVSVAVFGPREPKLRSTSNHDRASVVVEVGVSGWAAQGRGQRGDKLVSHPPCRKEAVVRSTLIRILDGCWRSEQLYGKLSSQL